VQWVAGGSGSFFSLVTWRDITIQEEGQVTHDLSFFTRGGGREHCAFSFGGR